MGGRHSLHKTISPHAHCAAALTILVYDFGYLSFLEALNKHIKYSGSLEYHEMETTENILCGLNVLWGE